MESPTISTRGEQPAAATPGRQAPSGFPEAPLHCDRSRLHHCHPGGKLWGWDILGILSQRKCSTSLSLEQVKDVAVSLSEEEGELESEKE